MLRASADAAGIAFDLTSIANRSHAPGRTDVEVLFAFTDALVKRTMDLDDARQNLLDLLGPEAVVAAAGSSGNFEMMNRILDAAGIPVSQRTHDAMGPTIGLP